MANVERDFTWNAEDYARNASAQYRWASELIARLALQGDERLLDIGCGDGRISAELASQLPRGGVVGIDASPEMIAAARQAYPSHAYRNLAFHRMDAREIAVAERFDIAFSNAVLHWVEDHTAVLQGVRRVMRPGGRLLLQMGGEGNAAAFIEAVNGVIADDAWHRYFANFHAPYYFYGIADYERWLPQCGFAARRIELIPKAMRHDSVEGLRGWFRTTWFPYTDRLPPAMRERFIDTVLDRYLARFPPDIDGTTTVAMVRLEVEADVCASAG